MKKKELFNNRLDEIKSEIELEKHLITEAYKEARKDINVSEYSYIAKMEIFDNILKIIEENKF